MLRIISAKISQRTPVDWKSDLSVPGISPSLAPLQPIKKFIGTEFQKRKKDKERAKWDRMRARWEQFRDPANGTCRVCRQPLANDARGRTFCPEPSCNLPKFSVPPVR